MRLPAVQDTANAARDPTGKRLDLRQVGDERRLSRPQCFHTSTGWTGKAPGHRLAARRRIRVRFERRPGFHGGNLSRAGDLAVVTLNHRLKVFKFGYFGDEDEQFAQSGTAGIWDIVQALEWVRDNIAVFDGESTNVTIFSQ